MARLRRNKTGFAVLGASLAWLVASPAAATFLSGSLPAHLTKAESPYIVLADLVLDNGTSTGPRSGDPVHVRNSDHASQRNDARLRRNGSRADRDPGLAG